MRNLALLVAPSAAALLALIACQDDPAGGGAEFSLDAGPIGFDASSPPTDATFPDAPAPDAAPDAPVVPAVSVTVLDAKGGGKAGVRIVFHDATGAVIDSKLTDAGGKAVHTGDTPAMASALLELPGRRRIVTWTGVEDGDDLRIRGDEADGALGDYLVTLPTLYEGAGMYRVAGPCGSVLAYGTGASLPLYEGCARAQNPVLVTARTFSGTTLAHAFKKGAPVSADAGTASVVVGGWTAPSTLTVSIAGLPPQISFDPTLLEISGGVGIDNPNASIDGSSVTFQTATGFSDAHQASISVGDSESFASRRTLTKRFAPAAAASLDYATLLPLVTDAAVDGSTPRRPVLSWQGSTVAADGGLVQVSFDGPDAADHEYEWTFVVPPGTNTVTAPAMPIEAEPFLPVDDAQAFIGIPRVLFVEADVLPSYAQFRAQYVAAFGDAELRSGYDLPAFLANGTYRTTGVFLVPL
ncbi:MAG: hypothetical protein KF782_34735 [Labilithrix sp.]|nr:hypothetical protein [Labilithrix sp.]